MELEASLAGKPNTVSFRTGEGLLQLSCVRVYALLLLPVACMISVVFLPLSILVPLLIAVFLTRAPTRRELAFFVVLTVAYAGLIAVGWVQFPLFPQAKALYDMNPDLGYWLRSGHLHAPRLLIASPGLLFSRIVGCTETEGMTIYSGALMLLTLYFMLEILRRFRVQTFFSCTMCCGMVAVLSVIMNGRLVFSFFGAMLLLYFEIRFERGECGIAALLAANVFAVAFAIVSSGTMMIPTVYTVLIARHRWKRLPTRKQKRAFTAFHMIVLIPVLLWFVPFVLRFLEKNLNYFGGGIEGAYHMLMHGLGRALVFNSPFALAALAVVGLAVLLCNIVLFVRCVGRRNNPLLPLLLIVNISVYGGAFGLSTALMGAIPLALIALIGFCGKIKQM